MQELPTDEAIIAWADGTYQQWILKLGRLPMNFLGNFSRAFYEISIANEFWDRLQKKLSARGVDASLQAEIATFRAEARFLKAYSYII
jgi:hypothetical protein